MLSSNGFVLSFLIYQLHRKWTNTMNLKSVPWSWSRKASKRHAGAFVRPFEIAKHAATECVVETNLRGRLESVSFGNCAAPSGKGEAKVLPFKRSPTVIAKEICCGR